MTQAYVVRADRMGGRGAEWNNGRKIWALCIGGCNDDHRTCFADFGRDRAAEIADQHHSRGWIEVDGHRARAWRRKGKYDRAIRVGFVQKYEVASGAKEARLAMRAQRFGI